MDAAERVAEVAKAAEAAEAALDAVPDAAWSVLVRDVDSGERLLERDPGRLLPTASLGKLYLLVELARGLEDGRFDAAAPLDRRDVAPVADSGLWQHLRADVLAVDDAATLVGTVSDNLATNVLLRLVGLEAVQARAAALAPGGSTLHDLVRDERGPGMPPRLSDGCADDLVLLVEHLATGRVVGKRVAARVLGWLAAGVDHSMVTRALRLDPLAHAGAGEPRVWSKTGTDAGVRGEAALVCGGGRRVAVAAVCRVNPEQEVEARRGVLDALGAVGEVVRVAVGAPGGRD